MVSSRRKIIVVLSISSLLFPERVFGADVVKNIGGGIEVVITGLTRNHIFSVLQNAKLNTERYRSGHNELDSKTKCHFGTGSLKNLDVSTVLRYHQEENFSQFSPSVLSFFQSAFLGADVAKI